MLRYKQIRLLGSGAFSKVVLAQSLDRDEQVAIKILNQPFHTFAECESLREVKVCDVCHAQQRRGPTRDRRCASCTTRTWWR